MPNNQDITGAAFVERQQRSTTAVRTSVASSASVVQLLAANVNRMGVVIVNDSTANLFVIFGAGGSTTDYTYKLTAGAVLELPLVAFTGVIGGIWDSVNGNARITELT